MAKGRLPGKGARSSRLADRVEAAVHELFTDADAVLIIACKTGDGSDTAETCVMRRVGSTFLMNGALWGLSNGEGFDGEMEIDGGLGDAEVAN